MAKDMPHEGSVAVPWHSSALLAFLMLRLLSPPSAAHARPTAIMFHRLCDAA